MFMCTNPVIVPKTRFIALYILIVLEKCSHDLTAKYLCEKSLLWEIQ